MDHSQSRRQARDRGASDLELRSVLDDLLRRHSPSLGRIVRLESNPCADQTSFNLADLEIELEDGSILRLLLKDLGLKNLHETARRVKPGFLYDPLREILTYQEILGRDHLGTAHFYGAVVRPDEDRLLAFPGESPGHEARSGERLLRLAAGGPLAGTPAFPVRARKRDPEPVRPSTALRCRLLPAVAPADREVSSHQSFGRAVWESLVDTLWSGHRTADPAPIHLDPWGVLCFEHPRREDPRGLSDLSGGLGDGGRRSGPHRPGGPRTREPGPSASGPRWRPPITTLCSPRAGPASHSMTCSWPSTTAGSISRSDG